MVVDYGRYTRHTSYYTNVLTPTYLNANSSVRAYALGVGRWLLGRVIASCVVRCALSERYKLNKGATSPTP